MVKKRSGVPRSAMVSSAFYVTKTRLVSLVIEPKRREIIRDCGGFERTEPSPRGTEIAVKPVTKQERVFRATVAHLH